jgi:tRNA nucleotidyltransferase (CCA-adding enzyme)
VASKQIGYGKKNFMTGLSPKVVNAICAAGRLYEVGGAVRDRLRCALNPRGSIDADIFSQYQPPEIDYLMTGIPLEKLVSLLSQYGKTELTGKSFGVIKFKPGLPGNGSEIYDIALPRRERSTGPGHRDFEVECDPGIPVEQDLGRRDFTVNAMALGIPGSEYRISNLIDPYGGVQDIRDKVLRQVNLKAFEEDPLRMLRACQFAARLQFAVEQETFDSIKKHRRTISSVAPERVQQELNKLLLSDKPSIGLWLMQRSGLLKELLPEMEEGADVTQPGGYHRFKVLEHAMVTADQAPRELRMRLAALLHDVAKPRCREAFEGGAHFYGHDRMGEEITRNILLRLRYSSDTIERVSLLVRRHMFAVPETEKGLRRLMAKIGVQGLYDLIELRRADIMAQGMEGSTGYLDQFKKAVDEELAKQPPFGLRDLALDGNDLMNEFGLQQGPQLGQILKGLLDLVLDHPDMNRREILMAEVRRRLGRP